jgi:hypothetical protein
VNHATMPLEQIESLLREVRCTCHMDEGCSACVVHDASYERWLIETAKECRNCPNCGNPPCGACQAGGICDESDCYCGEDRFDEPDEAQSSDDLDAEGELP